MKVRWLVPLLPGLWLGAPLAQQDESAAIAPPDAATPVIPVTELAPAPAPLPAGDEVQQIDEVIVTAQKTAQSARRVPVSITALDGETLQQIGAATLADVSLYVPNVRVDADDLGSPQVFIRGFGTNAFNPSFESSVAFVQDEIYFGRPGYFTEAMFDVERVEVLRGPQGTLFGKNTVAGVFNVISRSPRIDSGAAFELDGRYLHGDPEEKRFEGGVSAIFGDWSGARLSVLYRDKAGDIYNPFLDRDEEAQEQRAARLKLKLFPGHGFDAELTAVTSATEAPFWPFQLKQLDDDTRDYLEGFDENIEDDPLDFRTSFETPGFIQKGSDTAGLKLEWNAGEFLGLQDFTPVAVLGWSEFYIDQLNELDVSPANIARLDNHEDHDQVSAELRFSGRADSFLGLGTGFEFVLGGFLFESNYTLLAQVLAGGDLASYVLTDDFAQLASGDITASSTGDFGLPGLPVLGTPGELLTDGDLYRFDYTQNIRSQAYFGQFTWNLTENFAVTPGVRLSREQKRVNAAGHSECQGKALGRPCIMEQLLMSQDYDERDLIKEETDVSPKLALQYFADHDVNYYASYARGYKSGGFNAISFSGEDLEYQPESARTYEAGAKGKFFERTLGINLTLYRTRFENLQVLAFNGVFFDVSNAAEAESEGLEADFLWLTPWAPLRIAGSFGALDARYLSYPSAPAPISQGIGELQDLSGQRVAFAPRRSGTLTPTLSFPIGNALLTMAGDVIYQGDQFTDTDLDPATYVPAYTKYAARLIVAGEDGGWSVSLGGSNLGDKRVLNQVTDATFFPGTYFAQQASGRQWFATLSMRL